LPLDDAGAGPVDRLAQLVGDERAHRVGAAVRGVERGRSPARKMIGGNRQASAMYVAANAALGWHAHSVRSSSASSAPRSGCPGMAAAIGRPERRLRRICG
jgi:hypothetical protein